MRYFFYITYLLLTLKQINAQNGSIIITEILASNASINKNELDNFDDWIEIYNNADSSINLKGYYFTNNLAYPQKYKVTKDVVLQPNSYQLIWADRLDSIAKKTIHLNFKLNKKGGEIGIFHPDGETLVHHLEFEKQYTNYSSGISKTGNWLFFDSPTPGKLNNSKGKRARLPKVKASSKSGAYQKSISIRLSSNNKRARIYYTTDGSTPNDSSAIYRKPIIIDQTTEIKAIALLKGHYESSVVNFFYHIGTIKKTLPIVHISLPEDEFQDIYASNNHCNTNCSRKALITYIDKNGQLAFKTKAGIKISGKSSRENDQKSIALSVRKRFDSKTVNYDIFNIDTNYRIHSLLLRNGGNSWHKSFVNDVLTQSFANELDIDHQKWQPVITYINGKYWGIYHLREKINSRYLQYHHQLKSRAIDMADEGFKTLKGNTQSYEELIQFAKENDLSQTENYQKVIEQIDLENYMDYYALQIFFANIDWPRRNVKVWKSEATEKWRWILFDTDFSLALTNRNFIKWAMGEAKNASPVLIKNGALFKGLMSNDIFKKTFTNRLTVLMNTTFSPEKIVERIDTIQQLLNSEMPLHLDRWKHQCDKSNCIYNAEDNHKGMETWLGHLEQLKRFALKRQEYVVKDILEIE